MTVPILATSALGYRYPGGIAALEELTLEIQRGRRLAILGPNGCGKTTLLLHLNGTLRPTSGGVMIDGRPAGYDRAALIGWRSRVGLVLQDPDDQLFAATVAEDVSFGPLNQDLDPAAARARVTAALTALRIEALADRPTQMLSFGQKRRAAIAGILAMLPGVLLLDEPTAGLDAHAVVHLLKALERLASAGTTLVFTTHDVDLAYAWADDAALLDHGRLLGLGAAATLLADRALLRQARLRPPLILEAAEALHSQGLPWPEAGPPRTRRALLAMIGGTEPVHHPSADPGR